MRGSLKNNGKYKEKSKKKIVIIVVILIFVISILYVLADRYLIEHVEVDLSDSNNTESGDVDNISDVTETEDTKVDENYTLDDLSYISDTKSISIEKVVTGSGSDTVTYYVADIILKDDETLMSAFAKDKFGTNIIETTSEIATNNNALFAINGDYYGFRTTGIVIRNGVVYRDIGARTGLAVYKDGTMKIYDETSTNADELIKEGVINTYSFGPALLENGNILDGIETIEIDTNIGNHSIQGNQPRTGIGMIDKNHYVFIVVDGRSSGYSRGVTLTEFAKIFKDLNCSVAYNMDGGGSSTMYFNGKVINNPLGKNQERGTSDIIYVAY